MKKLFSSGYTDGSFSFGILVLRVIAGLTLAINHGYPKLVGFKEKSAAFTDPFGIGSTASLSLVVFAEFFCGILLVLGLLTRFASVPVIIAMSVAFFMSHNAQLFSTKSEPAALFLVIGIALLFTGPGKYSLDRMIGK